MLMPSDNQSTCQSTVALKQGFEMCRLQKTYIYIPKRFMDVNYKKLVCDVDNSQVGELLRGTREMMFDN